jgi:small subunit ribosomal protein S1
MVANLKQGETAEFQIIEFNKEFKRVVASHTAIHKEEEQQIVKQAAKKAAQSNDKTTIGDVNAELQAFEG